MLTIPVQTEIPTGRRLLRYMFQIFNYLQHCISCTAVQKNYTVCTQHVGNVNKDYRLQKIVFDGVCLCLCFVLGQRLRETFVLTSERVAGG